jgi:hypothetical protein
MRGVLLILLSTVTAFAIRAQERDLLRLVDSQLRFTSVAPLETITAACARGSGLIDRNERTFAVQLPVVEFMGFNAPLQREHFQENYMSVADWPHATFTGRIIEAIDLRAPGSQAVRAKGVLTIRGQAVERVIPCTVEVNADGVSVSARFEVPVADHGIRIPRVVQQKVAAVVQVEARFTFAP